jgi:hypothetical protein
MNIDGDILHPLTNSVAASSCDPWMAQNSVVTTSSTPRLLNPLVYALSLLYGPSQSSSSLSSLSSAEVSAFQPSHPGAVHEHDFLLWLQSRNVRRQLQSLHQQYCDSQQQPPPLPLPSNKLPEYDGGGSRNRSSSTGIVMMMAVWWRIIIHKTRMC